MKIFCFFFLKKAWYNWYKAKKLVIPTLNCSNLYLRAWYKKGTIGTIVLEVSNTNNLRGARVYFYYLKFYFIKSGVYKHMFKKKKSKYKHVVINKKKYYFYTIDWIDITGDAGHATAEEFNKFTCSRMITQAYIFKKTKKFIWTFSSYDTGDEVFSDRNVMPVGCVLKMTKLCL